MYVKNVDGKPVFATHLIECTIDEVKDNIRIPFQVKQGKIVSYSKEETVKITKYLKENNINYVIKSLINSQQVTIDENIKYENRSEIIDHIQNGKKPKHKKEMELEKRVETLENQVRVLMEKLNVKN